ncbi:MAG: ATP-binding protein [Syntrophorhabdus sp.]
MIKRKLFHSLIEHLPQKEMSLIVGPRQAGKTTLMTIVRNYLIDRGEKTLFLSLDFESDQPFFASQSQLINKCRLELGDDQGYVFIDEIQRKENAGLFLKGLYDMALPYKFILSGSGSLELKEKIQESLIGRKRVFELNTVSFEEFANFKTNYQYKDNLYTFFKIEKARGKELLQEYLNFGGYPRLLLETKVEEKRRLIDDIFRSYLERDIGYLLKVEKTEAFSSLVKVLASQIGKIINYTELSTTLGLSAKTVKNYLFYTQKTFIIDTVTPYYRNIRKEITKSPTCYFYDLGLRNYALGLFGHLGQPLELGFVFQNFVFNLLKERISFSPAGIHFWRTKDRAEVDFVIDLGKMVIPIEVKYKKLRLPTMGRSLRNFVNRYEPEQAWVINLSMEDELRVGKTVVRFLPFWEFLDVGPESISEFLSG